MNKSANKKRLTIFPYIAGNSNVCMNYPITIFIQLTNFMSVDQ